jgi:hypothetical protein
MGRRAYVFSDDDLPDDPPAPLQVPAMRSNLAPTGRPAALPARSGALTDSLLRVEYERFIQDQLDRPNPLAGLLAVDEPPAATTYAGIERSTVPMFVASPSQRRFLEADRRFPGPNSQLAVRPPQVKVTPEMAARFRDAGIWDDEALVIAVLPETDEQQARRFDALQRALQETEAARRRVQQDRIIASLTWKDAQGRRIGPGRRR